MCTAGETMTMEDADYATTDEMSTFEEEPTPCTILDGTSAVVALAFSRAAPVAVTSDMVFENVNVDHLCRVQSEGCCSDGSSRKSYDDDYSYIVQMRGRRPLLDEEQTFSTNRSYISDITWKGDRLLERYKRGPPREEDIHVENQVTVTKIKKPTSQFKRLAKKLKDAMVQTKTNLKGYRKTKVVNAREKSLQLNRSRKGSESDTNTSEESSDAQCSAREETKPEEKLINSIEKESSILAFNNGADGPTPHEPAFDELASEESSRSNGSPLSDEASLSRGSVSEDDSTLNESILNEITLDEDDEDEDFELKRSRTIRNTDGFEVRRVSTKLLSITESEVFSTDYLDEGGHDEGSIQLLESRIPLNVEGDNTIRIRTFKNLWPVKTFASVDGTESRESTIIHEVKTPLFVNSTENTSGIELVTEDSMNA